MLSDEQIRAMGGEMKLTRLSYGTGQRSERLWCWMSGGHIPLRMPDDLAFTGASVICSKCGKSWNAEGEAIHE